MSGTGGSGGFGGSGLKAKFAGATETKFAQAKYVNKVVRNVTNIQQSRIRVLFIHIVIVYILCT